MPHIYDKNFKYVTAKDSDVSNDYLRKKFKRIAAELKAQQAEAAKKKPTSSVLRLRRQA